VNEETLDWQIASDGSTAIPNTMPLICSNRRSRINTLLYWILTLLSLSNHHLCLASTVSWSGSLVHKVQPTYPSHSRRVPFATFLDGEEGWHSKRRNAADGSRSYKKVVECSIAFNILRGSFLRIASDLSGGTPLETIKCQTTVTKDNMIEAVQNILKEGGIWSLWAGTPSRTVEGALLGALFILGSTVTKKQVLAMGGSPFVAALAGGTVGGVAQALVMTPAGMIFTSLNVNRGKKGHENDNAITVMSRIIKEKGILGMYFGMGPMCMRQASNWASRSGFTEIARTNLRMSQYGVWGEIGSGVIGGVGSTWNTPIETIRVLMQKDVSQGKPTKKFMQYWDDIVEDQGFIGLFRGWTPRTIQAVWQTVFMVVVPNMLGI
jgi:hypothetical protein